jgi:hypothetical protein
LLWFTERDTFMHTNKCAPRRCSQFCPAAEWRSMSSMSTIWAQIWVRPWPPEPPHSLAERDGGVRSKQAHWSVHLPERFPWDTGWAISSVTLLKTIVAPLYEVVESSSCVHSISPVILHLLVIAYSPQKSNFCHNRLSIENPSKLLFARSFGNFIIGPTLIDRTSLIRGRRYIWLDLFESSGHNAYGNDL